MRSLKPELVKDSSLSGLMDDEAVQIRRLDVADRTMTDNNAEFMSIPSLATVFDEFTSTMLAKPSEATNVLELQEEFEQLRVQQQSDVPMETDDKPTAADIDFKFRDYFTF